MPRFHTDITADPSPFNRAMEEAAQKSLTTSQAMQSNWRESFQNINRELSNGLKQTQAGFDSMKDGIKALRGVIAGAAATIAGVLFMKKMADDSAKATIEAEKLASMLGITTQEAVALKIALGDIGVETDTYTGAVSKLVMNLRENEERFNALGVTTRDANGGLLSTEEIMRNAFAALMQFKEGTDRNLASSEIFGKGWAEVMRIMKLTSTVMEEAQQKAAELQMAMGPEGVARANQYKKSMGDIGDVVSAMANRIGESLMPMLTSTAEWFASIGPDAVRMTGFAMGSLISIFESFRAALVGVWNLIDLVAHALVTGALAAFDVLKNLLSGNFAGAAAAAERFLDSVGDKAKEAFGNIGEAARRARATTDQAFSSFPTGGGGESSAGKKPFTPEAKGSRVSQWEADLALQRDAFDRMKLEQGSFQTFSREEESAYWKAKIALTEEGSRERAEVEKKFYDVEREIRKQAFEAEIAELKGRAEAWRQGAVERIQIAGEAAARIGQKFGLESKEYKAAVADMAKAARERSQVLRQIEEAELDAHRNYQISRVALERENLETQRALGAISEADKLLRLRELKEIEFRIELAAAEARAERDREDETAYSQHLKRIEQIKQGHAVDLARMDRQVAVEGFRPWRTLFDSITDGFSTAIKGVIMGTQTLGNAMRNIFQTLVLSVIDLGVQIAARWILSILMARTAERLAAVSQIASNAAVAASAAFASTAAIPIVGPVLAPAAAVEAYGLTMAWMGAIPAALRGFDVPRGINPVTQLHGGEMVLPADIADPLREMVSGGAGGGDSHVHFHGPVFDPRGMERFFRGNAAVLTPALHRLARNFAYSGK